MELFQANNEEGRKTYCAKIAKLFEKYPVNECKDVYLSNSEILVYLFEMICKDHCLVSTDATEEEMVDIIDKYLKEDDILSKANMFKS